MAQPSFENLYGDVNKRRISYLFVAVTLVLGAAYIATAASGITWANYGADGGDLVAAVATLGVPHPSGYPTYVLLGQFFIHLPFADPALRLTLLSVVTMALAGGILAAVAMRTAPVQLRGRALTGLAVGLAFGLAPMPWSQAVIVEVHALNVLFVALALVWIMRLSRPGLEMGWIDGVLALACGAALGNHLTFTLMLPPIGLAVYLRMREGGSRRWKFLFAVAFLIGVATYLYLPLAARTHPPINWGDASTGEGFWWVVSGLPYRGLAFGVPLSELPTRIAAWAGLLVEQFGLVGVALGAIGLVSGRSKTNWLDRTTLWMAPVYSIFALGYYTPASSVYLIPAYLACAWWIGLGVAALMNSRPMASSRLRLLVPAAALLALGLRMPAAYRHVDASADRRAMEYIEQVMLEAPRYALLLTEGDYDSFPLWYAQYALGQRPDLHILVVPLTQFGWYRQNLSHTYPDLLLPYPGSTDMETWMDEVLARNSLPICTTQVTGELEELYVDFDCDRLN